MRRIVEIHIPDVLELLRIDTINEIKEERKESIHEEKKYVDTRLGVSF